MATIIGDEFDNNLLGSAEDDHLFGLAGDDTLDGRDGVDILSGGAGNDLLICIGIASRDVLLGGAGQDTVRAYAWNFAELILDAPASVEVLLAHGKISGTTADNRFDISGISEYQNRSGHYDRIFFSLADGEDTFLGSDLDDEAHGGKDNDYLEGRSGDDTLFGDGGRDWLDGGAGDDSLIGGSDIDRLWGRAGNDYLNPGDGDDIAKGGAGNDTIVGGPGRDHIDGGAGDDLVLYYHWYKRGSYYTGGAGEDTIRNTGRLINGVFFDLEAGGLFVGSYMLEAVNKFEHYKSNVANSVETIYGTAGANRVSTGPGNDHLFGRAGNDTLMGGAGGDALLGDKGRDLLFGQAGDDTLDGGPDNDILQGGQGRDSLFGGLGIDTASYRRSDAAVDLRLFAASFKGGDAEGDRLSGIENLIGSGYDDLLIGDAHRNQIWGWRGADDLRGFDGDDQLFGDDGDDTLHGGSGDDTLEGGPGADSHVGGFGRDTAIYLHSASGVAVDLLAGVGLAGDADGDTYDSVENVTGSRFDDMLYGDWHSNVLRGHDGNDALYGGAANDLLVGGPGHDTLVGGTGRDTASYSRSDAAVDVRLFSHVSRGGHAAGDYLIGIEDVIGSDYGDLLIGNTDGNVIHGGTGNDDIRGFDGADLLLGELGDDTLLGGFGDDTLDGGTGADALSGGIGKDTVRYTGSSEGIAVNLLAGFGLGGDAEGDTYQGVEDVIGSGQGDIIYGDQLQNKLNGGGGNDQIHGDTGPDRLLGGAGNDTLSGGDYRDTLNGGDGDDLLIGGTGHDRFVFTGAFGQDTVADFDVTDAEKIDLSHSPGISDFTDLLAHHLADRNGTAMLVDGANTILLSGIGFGDIGFGLAVSENDFIF